MLKLSRPCLLALLRAVWVARVLTADTGMAASGISSGSRGDHTVGEVGICVHRSGLFATRGAVGVGRVVCER